MTADAAGYQRLLDFARAHVPGRRCFAVEGAGSYDAGLTRELVQRREWVVEVDRPGRPARRGGKTDTLDAIRAAREALLQARPAVPRRRGDREALRVLLVTRHGALVARTCATSQLKALIVSAPEELRPELRGRSTSQPGRPLRRAAGSASQVAGTPDDRPGAALHRQAHPAARRRGDRPGE